jgi:hypothetical protein
VREVSFLSHSHDLVIFSVYILILCCLFGSGKRGDMKGKWLSLMQKGRKKKEKIIIYDLKNNLSRKIERKNITKT